MIIKDWMYSKWFIQSCNEGYIIVYADSNNEIKEVPFNSESFLCERDLAEHIVSLHNDILRKA